MALPNFEKINNGIQAIKALSEYSTEETIVGLWTNGKPLYRKVLIINAPDLNSHIYHNIANIRDVVDVKMMLREGSSNYVRILPTLYQEDDTLKPRFCISMYTFDTQKFMLTAGSYYVEQKARLQLQVCVEYTKTTD